MRIAVWSVGNSHTGANQTGEGSLADPANGPDPFCPPTCAPVSVPGRFFIPSDDLPVHHGISRDCGGDERSILPASIEARYTRQKAGAGMHKRTWVTLAVCGLLGGCADLVLPPSSPVTLTALEPDAQAADTDVQTDTDLAPSQPASTRPSRKVVHRPKPTAQEAASTSSTSDEAAIAAKHAQDEWVAQRERAAKRAVSGICTGC